MLEKRLISKMAYQITENLTWTAPLREGHWERVYEERWDGERHVHWDGNAEVRWGDLSSPLFTLRFRFCRLCCRP